MATSINTQENPESTIQSASGASYAIPANYYGIVRAHVSSGGSFSINSTIVLGSFQNAWTAMAGSIVGTYSTGGGAAFGLITTGNYTGTSSGNAFSSSTAYDSSTAEQVFKLKAGDAVSGSGTCRYHVELYRIKGT